MGILYLVATPIGNLKDITLRALETLKEVDGVICEDTRRTGLLLNHFEIKKPMLVLNDFNEARVGTAILGRLLSGQNLAMVSDGGTPLVSDPGYKLVRACLEQNIPVDSIPGPTALIDALVLSGLPPDKFVFLGYLPEKPGKRAEMLSKLLTISHQLSATYIAYVAPHKVTKTLENMQEVYGDIEVALAQELTKIHQSVKRDLISTWMEKFNKQSPKGELVLLFNLSHPL